MLRFSLLFFPLRPQLFSSPPCVKPHCCRNKRLVKFPGEIYNPRLFFFFPFFSFVRSVTSSTEDLSPPTPSPPSAEAAAAVPGNMPTAEHAPPKMQNSGGLTSCAGGVFVCEAKRCFRERSLQYIPIYMCFSSLSPEVPSSEFYSFKPPKSGLAQ